MTTFSITVPDDEVQLIAEAFAQQFRMETPLGDNDEPLTGQELLDAQTEFARQQCIVYITGIVRLHLTWEQGQQNSIPAQPVNLI